MSATYSKADVASHNKADNLWLIVDDDVYDLTKFQEEHPGGKKSMSMCMEQVWVSQADNLQYYSE